MRVLQSAEGNTLRARLQSHVERVRPGHHSPIIPVVVGSEGAALEASAALLDRGLLVPAIRPPSVPPGSSRLRITLSAAHTDDEVEQLIAALADVTAAARA
jgi:7-keto-8-aminopelargonate synthetase-like enzyme